jgi:hypothetical protein
VAWLTDDLVCDFAAIYHRAIDPDGGDFAGLTGPQFAPPRIPAAAVYQGPVRARLAAMPDEPATAAASSAQPVVATFEATPLMLTTHPLLMQFGEYGVDQPRTTGGDPPCLTASGSQKATSRSPSARTASS